MKKLKLLLKLLLKKEFIVIYPLKGMPNIDGDCEVWYKAVPYNTSEETFKSVMHGLEWSDIDDGQNEPT